MFCKVRILQAAVKRFDEQALYQGTTLVVPQRAQDTNGL
jgi:hypothetical protein